MWTKRIPWMEMATENMHFLEDLYKKQQQKQEKPTATTSAFSAIESASNIV